MSKLIKAVRNVKEGIWYLEAKPTSRTFHYISIGNLSFEVTDLWEVYQCLSHGDGKLQTRPLKIEVIRQLTEAFIVAKFGLLLDGNTLYYEGPNYLPVMEAFGEYLREHK